MTSNEPITLSEPQAKHVLVPLDGSEFALRALPSARELAQRLGAQVHAISVAGSGDHAQHLRALASGALDVDLDDDRVVVVSDEDPAEAIAHRARDLEPCIVCLTTHGRGRFHGAVVGSVARSILQQSPDPVLALGPMADNPGWSPRPRAWPAPLTVPRIVACVDGSGPSEQVLPLAAGWARALAMSLTILTAIDDAPTPLRAGDHGRHGADAESYVEHLAQEWRRAVPDTDGVVVRGPIGVADTVRHHLEQRPAGLVAVTTHARSGLQRVLLGAVAASIVQASVVPCLVAPVGR